MKEMVKNIAELEHYLDQPFKNGLTFSSQGLGYLVGEQSEGNHHNWIIGSPTILYILIIIA